MRKSLLFAFVLLGAILLFTSYKKRGNANRNNGIVGSWEMVRDYQLDSFYHSDNGKDQFFKAVIRDTTYPHGGSFVTITFKSNDTFVSHFWVPVYNEDGNVRCVHCGWATSTYSLLPGKLVLLVDPNGVFNPCRPTMNDTAWYQPLILDYIFANGVMTLTVSCVGYPDSRGNPITGFDHSSIYTAAFWKSHRTITFKRTLRPVWRKIKGEPCWGDLPIPDSE